MPFVERARVVIAPDSFKGSLGADRVATAIARGWAAVRPEDDLVLRPMADGGEGTLAVVQSGIPDAELVPFTATGPVHASVAAHWLRLPDGSAVVELAETSGMLWLPRDAAGQLILHPLDAHTRGVGEAIRAALDAGATHVHVALGGSCSTDAGAGILVGLGARLLDSAGHEVPLGNRGLARIATIDTSVMRTVPAGTLTVWSDVAAPLLGPRGAAAQFGQQKGITEALRPAAEAGLAHVAELLGLDPMTPGFGAAGGTTCVLAWLDAEIVQGASAVANLIGLSAAIAAADLVVTGEGAFDAQSAEGKAPARVTELAVRSGVPVALIAGRIEQDATVAQFVKAQSLVELAATTEQHLDSMLDAEVLLERAGALLAVASREE